jgi:transposase
MDAFDASPLCPAPRELQLDEIAFQDLELRVRLRARRRIVTCPSCGHATSRIHSHYGRMVTDLPWHGLRVRLMLTVRRFFCDVPECSRRIFTERLPLTVARYGRRTTRAASALDTIAQALGGRAGARLAASLGLVIGPGALLHHFVHRSPSDDERPDTDPLTLRAPSAAPRVLGVDDWAWRKGQRYGTILVDLDQHAVIDLLPDRESETLRAWLVAHPGIEFISRDRAGAYAEACARGAPDAIQIADRFHLLRNLTATMQHVVERHRAEIHGIGLAGEAPPPRPIERGPVGRRADALRRDVERRHARRAARLARYHEVCALHAGEVSVSEIHRRTSLSRATVMRWLAAGHFPERQVPGRRATSLSAHAAFLRTRWAAGCHNATALWRELHDQRGFGGGLSTVRDWVRSHHRHAPVRTSDTDDGSIHTTPTPLRLSARRAAWLLTAPPGRLNDAERTYAAAVCRAAPAIATAHELTLDFRTMLETHDPNALAPWLTKAESSELRSLATGLRRDFDAVLAAVLFPWSNGQVEGQVNRLKLVKRTMYGRASFALLRRRVLAA